MKEHPENHEVEAVIVAKQRCTCGDPQCRYPLAIMGGWRRR